MAVVIFRAPAVQPVTASLDTRARVNRRRKAGAYRGCVTTCPRRDRKFGRPVVAGFRMMAPVNSRKNIILPGQFADALGDLLKVKPPPKAQTVKSKPKRKAGKKR